ncbi:hypothetical protein L484_023173 [Morus notabilis]|uniref:Uncharacterized protein n=1 Tax=Morus notabilis TaxID=981085 RepID=W9SMZ3_9ROSA|nr:hypothetical protein L484_023173 [Morus notabilis]
MATGLISTESNKLKQSAPPNDEIQNMLNQFDVNGDGSKLKARRFCRGSSTCDGSFAYTLQSPTFAQESEITL